MSRGCLIIGDKLSRVLQNPRSGNRFEVGPGGGQPLVPAWTPLALGPAFWHDATQLAVTLTDGQSVAEWPDLSGNNRAKTQASPSSQPVFESAAINGLPGVLFDGEDDILRGSNDTTTAFTLWVIWRRPAQIRGFDPVLAGEQEGGPAYVYLGATSRRYSTLRLGDTGISDPVALSTEAACLYAAADPGDMLLRVSGRDIPRYYTPGENALFPGHSAIGGCLDIFAGGHVGEAGMVPRVLDAAEQDQLLAYLSGKWGVVG